MYNVGQVYLKWRDLKFTKFPINLQIDSNEINARGYLNVTKYSHYFGGTFPKTTIDQRKVT